MLLRPSLVRAPRMGKIKVAASSIFSRIKKVLIVADVDGFQPVRTVTSVRVSEKRASLNDRLLIVFESDIFLSPSSHRNDKCPNFISKGHAFRFCD